MNENLIVRGLVASVAYLALAGILGSSAYAQMGPKVRFANWEFELPPMLSKAEETRDKLVLRLESPAPGSSGTITLRAGEPLKGELAARLEAEWRQLVRNRKLAGTDPQGTASLADGTDGLRRSARLPGNGVLMLDAYPTRGGVNFMIVDATDETAAQLMDGAAAMLTMTAKLQPVTAVAGAGARPAPEASASPGRAPPGPESTSRRLTEQSGMMKPPGILAFAPAQQSKPELTVEKIAVPRRDAARIKAVPTRAPSGEELSQFVRRVEGEVAKRISKHAQALAARVLQEAARRQVPATGLGNVAVGLWMTGNLEAALHVMGKALAADPKHAENLSNYAALLNMAGGEHLALPILLWLEQQFPDNSTVLNNTAQAWFGLGELARAEAYLEKAVIRFPGHAQANFTKSVVAEHKGDKRGAVEAMRKSIAQAYSPEKEAHLERLGYPLAAADLRWTLPRKAEPLKLHKFLQLVPAYYVTSSEAPRAKAEWEAFRDTLQAEIEALEAKDEAIHRAALAEARKFASDAAAGRKRASPIAVKYTVRHVTYGKLPEFLTEAAQRMDREKEVVARKIEPLRESLDKVLKDQNATCAAKEKAVSAFMLQANTLWGEFQREGQLRRMIRWHEEWAHLLLYYNTPGPAAYQAALHGLKRNYLHTLMALQHEHVVGFQCHASPVPSARRGRLPHFEDLHCDKNIRFSVPFIGSFHVNCHYMSAEFDVVGIVSGKTKEDLNTGELVRASVEIGLQIGHKGEAKKLLADVFPIAAEAVAKGGLFLEFDNSGLTDVGVHGTASIGISTDILDKAGPEPWMKGEEKETHELLEKVLGHAEQGVEFSSTTRIGLNSGIRTETSLLGNVLTTHAPWGPVQ